MGSDFQEEQAGEGEEMKNLPALIDSATHTLANARTSAEVLEAKAQAQAALHYSKVTKAALEVQGDCLKMVCRAEERFADEIDASEDFKPGRDKRSGDMTFQDIGVTKQQAHDFRKVRDLGQEKVAEIVDSAVAEGRAPTKSEILSHHGSGIDPNVNPNPPEGFAKRIHMNGYIKELAAFCEKYSPQLIAGACTDKQHADMLGGLTTISDWTKDFRK